MKRLASVGSTAFALVSLYLLPLTGPLVSPQHELIFHLPGSATALFLPVLLDLLVVTAAVAVVLALAARAPRLDLLGWAAVWGAFPLSLFCTVRSFMAQPLPLPAVAVLIALWLVLCVVAAFSPPSLVDAFSHIKPPLIAVASLLALSGLLIAVQLAWFGWQSRNLNPPFISSTTAAQSNGGHRVIWVLLDELSYDQVFEHRYPGLALPNFDRLANESTVFTHAAPAAEYTRIAVPSLLTGMPLANTRPSADGRTILLRPLAGGAVPLRPSDTIFGDAHNAGLFTGTAGWYEPYCRLLPSVLDRCAWTYTDDLPADLSPDASLLHNMLQPFRFVAVLASAYVNGRPPASTAEALDLHRHRSDFEVLFNAGDRMLANTQPGLTLLHMPVPHPWGFYDRAAQRFAEHHTSYIDNLALADLYLGHLRAVLQAQGAWDTTDIVLMGDHSWRTSFVWANSAHWSAEDQAASRGAHFDDRPAFVVKLRGQHTPARFDPAFPAVHTRALLSALLFGRLQTPQDLQRWATAATM